MKTPGEQWLSARGWSLQDKKQRELDDARARWEPPRATHSSPVQAPPPLTADNDEDGRLQSFAIGSRVFSKERSGRYQSSDCTVERVEYGWQYRGLWYAVAGKWGVHRLTPKAAAEAVCRWLDEANGSK